MKNAIIGALLIMLALVWLNARGDAQPMIEDTTKGQTVGLRSASEGQRGINAMPDSFRPRLLAGRKGEQRVAGLPVPLAAGLENTSAATVPVPSTNAPDSPANLADFPVCVTIRNGPIHPNYTTNLHGRRSDNA